MTTRPTPRPGILDIAPYIGGEAKADGQQRLIRLASNENPYGPSPKAVGGLKALANDIHRYPDGSCTELREKLGEVYGLPADQLVCGAGLDELINIITRTYARDGDEVLFSQHGFLMYPIAAKAAGATPVSAPERHLCTDVDALLARVTPRTKLVFLANPNNPTGSYLPAAEVARLHAALPPHVLLVLDAAYCEFVTAADYSAGHELISHGNVVVGRTFSKIYGIAGLRLGWMHGPAEVIDALNRARGPFNVSLAAQVAGVAALDDDAFVAHTRNENARLRDSFTRQLQALGLDVAPSVGNFVLVKFGPAAETVRLALKSRGILVRQMGAYGLAEYLRITIGQATDMTVVTQAIAEIIGA